MGSDTGTSSVKYQPPEHLKEAYANYTRLYSELVAQKPSAPDRVGGGSGGNRGDDIGDDKRPHGSRTQKTPRAGKNSSSVPKSNAPKDPGRERYTTTTKSENDWEDTDLKMKGGAKTSSTTWSDRTGDGKSEAKETVCTCDPKEEMCMCGPREEMEKVWAKENLQPVHMKIFVAESAIDTLEDLLGEESFHRINVTESDLAKVARIPYFAKILAAYPTKSLNGRIYSEEVLSDASKRYVGKPFILDHDYEDSYKVHGKIVGAHYGVDESPYLNRKREGLWLDAIGLIPEELAPLIQGHGAVPPLLRGVSIGGEGDAEPTSEGMRLKKFYPTELSVTAFPGIEGAHIADFQTVTESYN